MSLAILVGAFTQGLLGSMHCPGMCGPFVHILNSRSQSKVTANLLYNAGRIISYVFFGFLLGLGGDMANQFLFSKTAAVIGGVFIFYLGLSYMVPAISSNSNWFKMPDFLVGRLSRLLSRKSENIFTPFFFGAVTGLFPCGLLLPAYGLALGTGDSFTGALIMISFSAGTLPAMLVTGFASNFFWKKLSGRYFRFASGFLMIFLGIFMIVYRFSQTGMHHHHH